MNWHMRKKMAFVYWSSIALIILSGFFYWFIAWRGFAYTSDAYVGGNQVYITPLQEGFVTSIHTDDTYLVKKGELLVELDKTDSLICLDRAEAHLAEIVRQVCQQFHQVFVYQSEIEARRAKFIETAQDFQHRYQVLPASGVSLEEYEHAVAALRMAYFMLQTKQTQYNQALSFVQETTIENHPSVRAAADQLKDAWVQLYRCNLYAPVEGIVSQRSIQVGMWAAPGKSLMSLIPLDQIWVNANFKETQMRSMKIGQRVKITSDLYGKKVIYNGKIAGLPGAAGNAISLLPPQNLSGNWIKIVQRLPVRVELDPGQLKKHPLRIGLSLEAVVDLTDSSVLLTLTKAGAPYYQTNIFEQEEVGAEEFIAAIINKNLDPKLIDYRDTYLQMVQIPLTIPLIVQTAIFVDPLSPLQAPIPEQRSPPKTNLSKQEQTPSSEAEVKSVYLPVQSADLTIPFEKELEEALSSFSLDLLLHEAMLSTD